MSVCRNNGIDIEDEESLKEIDSLAYISTIVELEEEFGIEFPDEVLTENIFTDINRLYNILQVLLDGSNCKSAEKKVEDDELEVMVQALKELEKINNDFSNGDREAWINAINEFDKKYCLNNND